jgi:hypothetical protein
LAQFPAAPVTVTAAETHLASHREYPIAHRSRSYMVQKPCTGNFSYPPLASIHFRTGAGILKIYKPGLVIHAGFPRARGVKRHEGAGLDAEICRLDVSQDKPAPQYGIIPLNEAPRGDGFRGGSMDCCFCAAPARARSD